MTRQPSDRALLSASGQDPEAFARFYRRHSRAVMSYLRLRLSDMETAADLTAEVFATALSHRNRFDPDRGPARAWLFGIANNLVATSLRRGYREDRARRRLGIPPLDASAEEYLRAEELIDAATLRPALARLVADLPPGERDAVLARIVDEAPYATIARRSGSSEAAIRQRVSRGLSKLALAVRRETPP
jgi:RNA polymerase sigma factor (sigma-70 family)